MKKITCLFIIFLFSFSAYSQDRVSIKSMDDFAKAKSGQFITKLDLGKLTTLSSATIEFLKDNESFISYKFKNSVLELSIKCEKNEAVIYQKLFYIMGLHEIEVKKGNNKGIHPIDAFFKLLNLQSCQ